MSSGHLPYIYINYLIDIAQWVSVYVICYGVLVMFEEASSYKIKASPTVCASESFPTEEVEKKNFKMKGRMWKNDTHSHLSRERRNRVG